MYYVNMEIKFSARAINHMCLMFIEYLYTMHLISATYVGGVSQSHYVTR